MTAGRTIYIINQTPELARAWREFSPAQKRQMIKACETAGEAEEEIEKILLEVADGQRRLF